MTHTRTHVLVNFADPFLVCSKCRRRVTGYHSPEHCGCDAEWWNVPCEHNGGVTSLCPSWGPTDGCQCLRHLGVVPHPPLAEIP